MVTIKQINKHLNTFADNHQQIHSYGFGDLWEIASSGTINYPLMWVEPLGSTVRKGEIEYRFRILIMDLVQKGEGDETDVLSDTHRIGVDIATEIRQGGLGHSYEWELFGDVTMEDFTERFDEEVTGWGLGVTIKTEWDYNRCSIPTTGNTGGQGLQTDTGEILQVDQ